MENNFILKNNQNEKIKNFGVSLNGFIEKKLEAKIAINDLLALLNFSVRSSTSLGAYESTTADLNDRETFIAAFNFLQIYDIANRYRVKGTIYEYWTCRKTIIRKKITAEQLDTVICGCCNKRNSKYSSKCWACGNPL
ncbi:MAG: hypothetical protein IAX22_04795 [Candidatus Bathyarchaeota archaeon]|nr:hypothetical protein [Candidatus Bathyarchaeota archaeon]